MSVPAAYIGVILIWSTTPLAIQWSGEEIGFLFGLTGRMVLGTCVSLMLMGLFSMPLPWHAEARKTYLAAGLGIFCAMSLTYWSSQYIPSGWIALMFGLAPIITGVMAVLWLDEKFSSAQFGGMLVSLAGLAMIFSGGKVLGAEAIYGLTGMLFAVSLHSASAVAVKRIGATLSAMAVTTGGLLIAAIMLLMVTVATGEPVPLEIPRRAVLSIVYLGLIGSVLGFTLYFYVLRYVKATRVALITLLSPVFALLLGNLLNEEVFRLEILGGAGVILGGLLVYTYGDRVLKGFRHEIAPDMESRESDHSAIAKQE